MGPLVANFPQLTDKAALGMTEDLRKTSFHCSHSIQNCRHIQVGLLLLVRPGQVMVPVLRHPGDQYLP